MSLAWPGKALGSLQKSWTMEVGRRPSGLPCSVKDAPHPAEMQLQSSRTHGGWGHLWQEVGAGAVPHHDAAAPEALNGTKGSAPNGDQGSCSSWFSQKVESLLSFCEQRCGAAVRGCAGTFRGVGLQSPGEGGLAGVSSGPG